MTTYHFKSEQDAANIVLKVTNAVRYMHDRNIAVRFTVRDIDKENYREREGGERRERERGRRERERAFCLPSLSQQLLNIEHHISVPKLEGLLLCAVMYTCIAEAPSMCNIRLCSQPSVLPKLA